MIAYAVVHQTREKAIAIFLTKSAAEGYAAGYPQCSVVSWTVPEDLFDLQD